MWVGKGLRRRCGAASWGALVVTTVAVGACEGPTETRLADESLISIEADQVIFGMEDYLTTDGIRNGVIRADTAYVFNDSSQIRMWGVEMSLFHDDGRERAHVTSDRGTLHRDTEEMVAYGNVVLVMNQGAQRVESPVLHYDPDRNRIWSDTTSVFMRDGRVTRGSCFRSDLEFTNYTICNIRGAADIGRERGGGGGP